MSVGTTKLQVAEVETATRIIKKARVEVGDGFIVVMDRKRREIERLEGAVEEVQPNSEWRIGDATVKRAKGCGCGGTQIQEKS